MFDRWAGKVGVTDIALLKAVADIERGLIDADLGGNLFKQRVARPGEGRAVVHVLSGYAVRGHVVFSFRIGEE